jgi:hypothetical protein
MTEVSSPAAGLTSRPNDGHRWTDEGADMNDRPRPVLLGYLRKHLLMSETELEDAKERLAYFAEIEGFTMGAIYVEEIATVSAAFEALVDAVNRHEVSAVVLPSMLHFAVLGAPASIKGHFEHCTGARVLVAGAARP